jgi:YD repeat-containing protein
MRTCRWVGLTGLVFLACKAPADETRTFSVLHGGKPIGSAEMRFSSDEGATECSVEIRVDERTPAGFYRYTLTSREVWRDGRAISLRSSAEEDGYAYSLVFDSATGDLTANGSHRRLRREVWPTTFAQLPATGTVFLLDADSGRVTEGRLEKVRTETVRAAGKDVAATRHHVTGGRDVTLWYDDRGRLIRQSWIVAGSEMVLDLVECRTR